MNVEARRNLQALEAIERDGRITQRSLSDKLGIALGLTNIYLKRLVRKGYVKCVGIQPNRLSYLLTPKGISEKTRLTYEFMEYSLFLYRQVRVQLRARLEQHVDQDRRRVALYGVGEIAELAYLSIAECGLELVAVFDGQSPSQFLGHPVRDVRQQADVAFDLLIVAVIDPSDEIVERLVETGIDRRKLVTICR
jgi:DNA-binding MarR family transcriptional regulator